MPGVRPGLLRGESAAVAIVDYHYLVGPWLTGFVSASLGNAFGPGLAGFAPELLRMGVAVGVRTAGDPDQSFTVTAGLVTETIDQGFGVASVRLLVGTQPGP
jgi:hypothetical protein